MQGITIHSSALLLCWMLSSYEYTNEEEEKKLMQVCYVSAILDFCLIFAFHTWLTLFLKFLNSLSTPHGKHVCLWIGTIGETGIRGKTWLRIGTVQTSEAWRGIKGTWKTLSSALNIWRAEYEATMLPAVYVHLHYLFLPGLYS